MFVFPITSVLVLNTIEMEILLLETVHYYQNTQENRHMEAVICDSEIANYTRFLLSVEHHWFSFLLKIIFCLFLKKNKSGGWLYHLKKSGNPDKSGQITPLEKAWASYTHPHWASLAAFEISYSIQTGCFGFLSFRGHSSSIFVFCFAHLSTTMHSSIIFWKIYQNFPGLP